MLAGKKGFERILRAAETVFTGEISWLFYDISAAGVVEGDATQGKEAQIKHAVTKTEDLGKVLVPKFPAQISKVANEQDDLVDLLEWISLASIGSPRIQQGDLVDEIISRYEVPGITSPSATDATGITTQNLTKTTFSGFMPSSFLSSIFGDALIRLNESWFAVLVHGFEDGKTLVILKTEDNRVLSWDVEG